MATYEILLDVAADAGGLDTDALISLAQRVMKEEGIPEGTGLGLLLADDAELRGMNARFRAIDAPTDVLSFPAASGEEDGFPADDEPSIGDIAISLETARRQAAAAGRELQREVEHLLVHGLLHLCGYDHEAGEDEEEAMRSREERYLGDLSDFHDGTA